MLAFLEQLKADHNDDASIRAFNEIQNHLTEKKFGLVFEEHLPECTPLWEIPVKRGSLVAKKRKGVDNVANVIMLPFINFQFPVEVAA